MDPKTKKEKEAAILTEVISIFPSFLEGIAFASEDIEPPDFIGKCEGGQSVGLELTRWLNCSQTSEAVKRERIREQLLRIIDFNGHPRPRNFTSIVITPEWKVQIAKAHCQHFCEEFHAAVQQIDSIWEEIRSKHWEPLLPEDRFDYEAHQYDLTQYPTLCKYISSIWFREPDKSDPASTGGYRVSVMPDGGLYDPTESIQALRNAVESKVIHYSKGSVKAVLDEQKLHRLFLLVYTDSERFTSNTTYQTGAQMMKSPIEGLADAAQAAVAGLDMLPRVFDGIFLYYSVWNSQWLAQIWPSFQPVLKVDL
jgi:hypothetical protein